MLPELEAVVLPAATLEAVRGLTGEQVTALAAPFLPTGKVPAVFTAQSFTLTVALPETAPRSLRLRAFVYVLSSNKAVYAPLAYDPFSRPDAPLYLKTTLFRLTPATTGAEEDLPEPVPEVNLNVTLPEPLKIARVHLTLHSVLTPQFGGFVPLPETP